MRSGCTQKQSINAEYQHAHTSLAFVDQLQPARRSAAVRRLADQQFDAAYETVSREVRQEYCGALSGHDGNCNTIAAARENIYRSSLGCHALAAHYNADSVAFDGDVAPRARLEHAAGKAHDFLSGAGDSRQLLQLQPKRFNWFGGVEFEVEGGAVPGDGGGYNGHCRWAAVVKQLMRTKAELADQVVLQRRCNCGVRCKIAW